MSDTPRTDNLHQRYHSRYTDGHYTCYVRDVFDFARQLERELAEAREELAETRKDYACLATRLDGHDATECRANLDQLIEQRNLLLEGLEQLASCDWVITLPDRMDAVREIARETLNKI